MTVQPDLCWTCLETMLLVFPRGESYVIDCISGIGGLSPFKWVLVNYVPPTEGGGHIVFGAVPVGVGVGVGVRVRVASFLRDIF